MFQNIAEEEKQEEVQNTEFGFNKIDMKENLKKAFTKQNMIIYVISFMLSTVSAPFELAPFGLAIFAGALSNGLPAGIVFITSLIRNRDRNRYKWNFTIYIKITTSCSYDYDI